MTMGELNKKRVVWIDYAKAFAMLFVIIGHVETGSRLTNWVYSFHMPLFFFLSGITLKADRGGKYQYIDKLLKRIIGAYLAYSILYFIYDVVQVIILHKEIDLIKTFCGIFVQMRGTEWSIGLWFLPLLFITEIFVHVLITKIESRQYLIMLLATAAGFLYARMSRQVLPWGIDAVPIAALFVWLGYCYKSKTIFNRLHEEVSLKLRMILCLTALLINLIVGKWNVILIGGSVDMHKMIYGNPALYIIAAISGIIFISLVCQILSTRLTSRLLQYIGENTLHIYCIHGLVLAVIKKIYEIIQQAEQFVCNSIGIQLLIACGTLSFCLIIIYVYTVTKRIAFAFFYNS